MTEKKSGLMAVGFSIAMSSILLLSIFVGALAVQEKGKTLDKTTDPVQQKTSQIEHSLASMPGWFTENQGQIENHEVRFVYAGSSCSIGFIESGYLLKITGETTGEANIASVVRVVFEGANPVTPKGNDELSHKSNYFRGSDPAEWRTGVSNYNKVVYENLYDGIDLVFYTTEKGLKYDFIMAPSIHSSPAAHSSPSHNIPSSLPPPSSAPECISSVPTHSSHAPECVSSVPNHPSSEIITPAPGSVPSTPSPDEIQYSYEGANDIFIDPQGNLHITTPAGEFVEEKPFSYQMIEEKRGEVPSGFVVEGDTVSYDLSDHDPTKELVIDPLIYSTYVGGSDNDIVEDMTLDEEDNMYVTGYTRSTDFPTTDGCYDSTRDYEFDVFIFKMKADGSELLYSTYVGGNAMDYGDGITIDSDNNAHVTGYTLSPDFPTTWGAFDNVLNGDWDAFALKLNADGSDLEYSTLLGGSGQDRGQSIVVGEENLAYIGGYTNSDDYPTTPDAYDPTFNGERDVFVTKVNADGSGLIYSTYIGGNETDGYEDVSLAIDWERNLYVSADTFSENFPTTSGAYDETHNGSRDVFVCKLNPDGSDLIYSTLVGGSGGEVSYRIFLDEDGNAYLPGITSSEDFPTSVGCFDDTYNGGDMDGFIIKLNSNGSQLLLSTYLGGDERDWISGVNVDNQGYIYATGTTWSRDFPTTNGSYADEYIGGTSDIVIVILDQDASHMTYGTFFGGTGQDWCKVVKFDVEGRTVFAGGTRSDDFPTTEDAYDPSFNEEGDVVIFIMEIEIYHDPYAIIDSISPDPANNGELVQFNGHGVGGTGEFDTYVWRSSIDGEFFNGTSNTTSYSGLSVGDHTIHFKVCDSNGTWSGEVNRTLTIEDNRIPTVSITDPEDGDVIKGRCEIKGSAEDQDGNDEIQKVEIRIDHGDWKEGEGTTSWSFEWDSLEVDDGEHTIYARAYDGKDYSDLAGVDVTVNNEEPANHLPIVEITEPESGSTVEGVVTIEGTAEDEDGNEQIEKVEIRINDGGWGEAEIEEAEDTISWSFEWDSTGIEDGEHTIHARAYDGEDYSQISEVDVTVDNEEPEENHDPEIEITSVDKTDDYTVQIQWTASDPDGDALSISLSYDSDTNQDNGKNLIAGELDNTGTYHWDISGMEEVEYYIFAVARDPGGGEGSDYSKRFSIVFPEKLPDFEITFFQVAAASSDPGENVFIQVSVKNIGNDLGTGKLIFTVDDDTIQSFDIDLRQGEEKSYNSIWIAVEGNHTIGVEAPLENDPTPENNRREQVVVVKTMGDDKKGDEDDLPVIFVGLSIIILLVVGGILFAVKKEQKSAVVTRCPGCGGETQYSEEENDYYCWECEEYLGYMNEEEMIG